jgi:hypothetical protein
MSQRSFVFSSFWRQLVHLIFIMQIISVLANPLDKRQIRSSTIEKIPNATRTFQNAVATTSICEPATRLGLTLVLSPNSTSRLLAGNNVTVSWKFSSNGDYELRLPVYIDAQWQFVGEKTSRWDPNNKQVGWVATGVVMTDQVSFVWSTSRDMRDGWYRLRILPDGKDFYATPAPCFSDLDVVPGMSASFFVGTSRIDGVDIVPDKFGPSSLGRKLSLHLLCSLCFILMIPFIKL